MFQSTHSLRSATLVVLLFSIRDIVSIHALLAECDGQAVRNIPIPVRFNPRTPCGVRQETALTLAITGSFNPRTPCGVRREKPLTPVAMNRFNPRTPCGVRRVTAVWSILPTGVSIHALLAECDNVEAYAYILDAFQSTHSLRSATICYRPAYLSPHSFNPRTPCGVRHIAPSFILRGPLFQSTHSLRSATVTAVWAILPTGVSIHALLAECDSYTSGMRDLRGGF